MITARRMIDEFQKGVGERKNEDTSGMKVNGVAEEEGYSWKMDDIPLISGVARYDGHFCRLN